MKKEQRQAKQKLSLNKIIIAHLSPAQRAMAAGPNGYRESNGNTTVDTHWPTTAVIAVNACTTVDTHWPTTA